MIVTKEMIEKYKRWGATLYFEYIDMPKMAPCDVILVTGNDHEGKTIVFCVMLVKRSQQ